MADKNLIETMARQLRIQYPGAVYHVTCRGNERQKIYRAEEDYTLFLEKLADSLSVYNVMLLSYVCMTNHFHLLIQTPDGNLADFMRHFNISYTSAFNRRYSRSGNLYQGRYKSFLIEAEHYLMQVSKYIHLNPIKIEKYARKSEQEKTQRLLDFEHSSLKGFFNLRKRQEFVNYQAVLDYIGGDQPKVREKYQQFVLDGIGKDEPRPLDIGRGSGIVGSVDFIASVKDTYLGPDKKGSSQREQPQLKKIRATWRPDDIIRIFSHLVKQDPEALCTKGKNSTDRAMLMELLYRYGNIAQPEIGRLVGGIDYSAVSVARKRLRIKMEEMPDLKQRFEWVVKELSRIKI